MGNQQKQIVEGNSNIILGANNNTNIENKGYEVNQGAQISQTYAYSQGGQLNQGYSYSFESKQCGEREPRDSTRKSGIGAGSMASDNYSQQKISAGYAKMYSFGQNNFNKGQIGNESSSAEEKLRTQGGQMNKIKDLKEITITNYEEYQEVPVSFHPVGSGLMQGNGNVVFAVGKGGIGTGCYRFEGAREELKDDFDYGRGGSAFITDEEINEEINRRKRLTGAHKKKYELIDKYYATTEVDPKSVKMRENEEKFEEEAKYRMRSAGGRGFEYGANYSQSQMQAKGGYDYGNYQAQVQVQGQTQAQGQGQIFSGYSNGHMQEQGANFYSSGVQMQGQSASSALRNQSFGANFKGSVPYDNFSKYILEQINKIRTNPQSFIGVIEDSKANITKDRHGRLIYKTKIKVALANGEPAFNEAIEFLRNVGPMPPLAFNPEIAIEPPRNENEINDRYDLKKKVEIKVNKGINIRAYWRDVIKDPDVSFLLTIVDDNNYRGALKRMDILNPNMRYIGISSSEIDGKFVCYVTLSPDF